MADYRFSAKVIKRSNGQSAVASSAYRSATNLYDERTGQTCDYSRKSGVIHSEVMTPEGTPEWMHDRAQLWNAVEAVERRKDAQLAREIQLSLPHELTDAQRQNLVRGFVQEQFVNQGMIADIAIHAPSAEGDQRNHHAHIMLTMRALTGGGFGKKNRDWNNTDLLENWREQWAHHQNRDLERYGHKARVDHRSFEAQGIDREPTQHLGPVASDMERRGKASRIGDENRQTHEDNLARISDYLDRADVLSAIDYQKAKLANWAEQKRRELESAQDLSRLDLDQKHQRQILALESKLSDRHGDVRKTLKAELGAVERRLEAKGVRKLLRTVFGQTRTDKQAQNDLSASLAKIDKREAEERGALESRQDADRRKEARQQAQSAARLEKGIRTATERREKEGWKPTSPRGTKRVSQRQGRPERVKQPEPAPTPPKPAQNRSETNVRPIKGRFVEQAKPAPQEPDLADKKTKRDHVLDRFKGEAKRPWESASFSQDNKRPWETEFSRRKGKSEKDRERKPDGGRPRGPKK